jgi:hypothetical protein
MASANSAGSFPSNPVNGYSDTSGNPDISGADLGVAKANNRVTVNLHASLNVAGDVDLIASSGEVLSNVVFAAIDLSASHLFADASSGVIEFWETSGNRGTIRACISAAGKSGEDGHEALYTGFTDLEADLSGGLHGVINGSLDAAAAAPFNAAAYTLAEYNTFASLGDMVLALYSHYLFGHVAATAAIDNDAALVSYINGSGSANAAVGQGLAAALGALPASTVRQIARQVLSQDPSRARAQDNNTVDNDEHQVLIFAPGDIVYVQVAVDAPTVNHDRSDANGDNGAALSTGEARAPGASNLVGSAYPTASPSFAIRINLD